MKLTSLYRLWYSERQQMKLRVRAGTQRWGASVLVRVEAKYVGHYLRLLEWNEEIFIANRGRMQRYELWELRSDSFPAEWHKRACVMLADIDRPGVTVMPLPI